MTDDLRALSDAATHGPIVVRDHEGYAVYCCADCGQNINMPVCSAKGSPQPNPPTFDSLLNDPTQQLDAGSEVLPALVSAHRAGQEPSLLDELRDALTACQARQMEVLHERDAALAAAQEHEAWRDANCEQAARLLAHRNDLLAENARLRAQVGRVGALHFSGQSGFCDACGFCWPCETRAALAGEDQ